MVLHGYRLFYVVIGGFTRLYMVIGAYNYVVIDGYMMVKCGYRWL